MSARVIAACDQGTSSSRALLVDLNGRVLGVAQRELTQHYPKPGWVEHDPVELVHSQWQVVQDALDASGLGLADVIGLGITNQRETTLLWERQSGRPICNAIVWQDRRSSGICEALAREGAADMIRERTGLLLDPYFSATKIRWILDHVPGARSKAEQGDLLFGTVDTWLIWNLTDRRVHATDPSNASRTLLYNIDSLEWDDTLLEIFRIPRCILPEVRDTAADFGLATCGGARIPIRSAVGDQQAALFGQACFEPGLAKNTYGTGCFLLLNTGTVRRGGSHGLLSTVGWRLDGAVTYALEGSVLIAGAAIQWLRDGLGILASAAESEALARQAGDADEVVVVPAFAGLGAPYWDMHARGAIFGLTQDAGRAQLVRATLQSLAYQTRDVLDAMQKDTGIALKRLKVDGGACVNDFLMQFQADILGVEVDRPRMIESTALGAAGLAGVSLGVWDQEDIASRRQCERIFRPSMQASRRAGLYGRWQEAVRRSMGWIADEAAPHPDLPPQP